MKHGWLLAIGALVALFAGSQSAFCALGTDAIFRDANQKDTRRPMTSGQYPWSAIGRISHTDAQGILHSCTGALVGESLVLTAAHCVLDFSGATVAVHFQAAFNNGKFAGESDSISVFAATSAPDRNWASDWALVVLQQPLGLKQGYMKVRSLTSDELPFPVAFAGYSEDFSQGQIAGTDTCAVVQALSNGAFGHNCSTQEGASGGPLFYLDSDGVGWIVGINTRGFSGVFDTYSQANANIAVMSSAVIQRVRSQSSN